MEQDLLPFEPLRPRAHDSALIQFLEEIAAARDEMIRALMVPPDLLLQQTSPREPGGPDGRTRRDPHAQ